MKISLNFLFLFCGLVSADQHRFFKDAGVVIEPVGSVYTYSTFIYEKINFYIPKYNLSEFDGLKMCDYNHNYNDQIKFKTKINRIWTDAIKLIQKRVDPYESKIFPTNDNHVIERRFAPLLFLSAASLLNIGFSLYNNYQVHSLKSSLRELEIENWELKSNQNNSVGKINEMIDNMNRISTLIVPQLENEINNLKISEECSSYLYLALADFQNIVSNTLINRVLAGIDNLFQNRITPDFLPLETLKNTLLKRKDMQASLYQDDTSLVYRLGSFVIKRITHDPFLVSGVLILPKLIKKYVGTTIAISKVPVIDETTNSTVVLNEPDFAIRDDRRRKIWCPNFDICIKQSSTFYCPLNEIRTNPSACYESLIYKENMENCHYKHFLDYPLVKQTSSGLLVASSVTKILKIDNSPDAIKKFEDIEINSKKTFFISHHNGSEFMIDNEYYYINLQNMTITDTIEFSNAKINIPLNITNIQLIHQKEIENLKQFHLTEIEHLRFMINEKSFPLKSLTGKDYYIIIFQSFTFILIITIIIYQYKKNQNLTRTIDYIKTHTLQEIPNPLTSSHFQLNRSKIKKKKTKQSLETEVDIK